MLSLKMALRSIGASKMRSILTMLGIIIGVMALVVLVSLVSGATDSVTSTISSLGSSQLTVTLEDDTIDLDTLEQWESSESALGQIAPYATDSAEGSGSEGSGSVTVYGTTESYYDIQNLQLSMGRWLKQSDLDNHTYVCVLNQTAAEELVGYTDCVGQAVTLNQTKYTIVGVLADDENSLTSLLTSGTMIAYLPYTSLVRLSGTVSPEVSTFYVSAPQGGTLDQAETAVTDLLMEYCEEDEDAFEVSSQDSLESALSSVTSMMTVMLGGIAGISLVVGGIGIMNIMLVTVTERTREIGIRKAIGASRGTILTQFLMEAVVLCMMGCCLGIFLSWAILQIVNTVVASLDMAFHLNLGVVLISVGFCFVIGLVFGLYPANKAAKMKPIDALHHGG